ncbi:hypothetical protein EPO34_04785 [Patescibacteria group bacterium]|nr:MAG: hypothetical protein EPO34_04785 [Patescibacteria group bacterium]
MTRQDGYVMLMNVLVVSVTLITVSAAVALALARGGTRGPVTERSRAAQRLAEACAEVALYELQQSPSYAGNETVTIGGLPCTIRPVIAGPPLRLQAEATADQETYRIEIQVDDPQGVGIGSWKRVATFD